jgi:hypothetical protein
VKQYQRPIGHAERAQLAHINPGAEAVYVIVSDAPPGRIRGFADTGGQVFSLMFDIDDVA